jgi:hypothetical protein
MSEEQRIGACKTATNQIYTMLRSSPQQWQNFLGLARTIITQLDSTTFMQQATRTAEQVSIIAALQILAFKDVDNGAIMDIASWCSRQWLILVQRDEQNVSALRGLGQMWLSRAQPALARVHASHSRASSSTSGSPRSESAAEAERRVGTADYVEARGLLQPAAEYLERAVTAGSNQDTVSGDLLAKVRCLDYHVAFSWQRADRACRRQKHTCLLGTSQGLGPTSSISVVLCSCCSEHLTWRATRYQDTCKSKFAATIISSNRILISL